MVFILMRGFQVLMVATILAGCASESWVNRAFIQRSSEKTEDHKTGSYLDKALNHKKLPDLKKQEED